LTVEVLFESGWVMITFVAGCREGIVSVGPGVSEADAGSGVSAGSMTRFFFLGRPGESSLCSRRFLLLVLRDRGALMPLSGCSCSQPVEETTLCSPALCQSHEHRAGGGRTSFRSPAPCI
jgi:hypothetical protein